MDKKSVSGRKVSFEWCEKNKRPPIDSGNDWNLGPHASRPGNRYVVNVKVFQYNACQYRLTLFDSTLDWYNALHKYCKHSLRRGDKILAYLSLIEITSLSLPLLPTKCPSYLSELEFATSCLMIMLYKDFSKSKEGRSVKEMSLTFKTMKTHSLSHMSDLRWQTFSSIFPKMLSATIISWKISLSREIPTESLRGRNKRGQMTESWRLDPWITCSSSFDISSLWWKREGITCHREN